MMSNPMNPFSMSYGPGEGLPMGRGAGVRGNWVGGPPPPGPSPPGPQEAAVTVNDCEIITLGNPDQNYVNMVENAIKEFGLKVDVMIPRPTVKMSSFISNLAMKGTIFAVVIRPDNVEHRSVSVHVLLGPPKPEEHRNMPLSTAYSLIQKCYLELKKKEIGGVPEDIKPLFRYILDERPLTDKEYAIVIAFLQERRKQQSCFDSRGSYEAAISSPEELQQRILKILHPV